MSHFGKHGKKKRVATYTLINKHNIGGAAIVRVKKGGDISAMKIDDFAQYSVVML